ncbi:bifunctional molybdopterin-guanine dinucleotide biosynthesis adaptor protein MobB/molybdopterin molybdotransferase MoeA [Marinobacterium jannaschii]|uniref:bifunctional molybdopterin-guanine dinucleotide biosynthesis adaptor protein MobB/molybdopterin molybdotransferase MoeA n=1 Tax=Marinobacterium jannaschii TaxID=64970 RepID=UPI00056D24AF|nr:bifunctional molybdopterin-guanine dinucleotide biosynthesis adaptor protein MobB/molybdopterin molybdotransferase MoeA [Marinobacterium jannaschii]
MTAAVSCFDSSVAGQMLQVDESLRRILEAVPLPDQSEDVPLHQALDRVLAEPAISAINVPQQTNSAMDGYAIRAATRGGALPARFEVVGPLFAGQCWDKAVAASEAVEIMTGAPLPVDCDAVVIREAVQRTGAFIQFDHAVAVGENVRQAGEDIARGSCALAAGTLLRPQELGLLASLGYTHVRVFKRLKVAVFSTGDEVVAQGQELAANAIYDTNRYSLHGLLGRLGCEVIDLGIVADNPQAMVAVLEKAAAAADVVFSSGGVSMGKADYIKSALEQVGCIGFWRIAMRPGRPLAFGHLGDTPFFGLPGNPVAVMVTFMQFAQPALRKMMGQSHWQPRRMVAQAESNFRSRAGRTDYSRGICRINDAGTLVVASTGKQGSGILSSMVEANCLVEIGDNTEKVALGDQVVIQPFSDLL